MRERIPESAIVCGNGEFVTNPVGNARIEVPVGLGCVVLFAHNCRNRFILPQSTME
jgi:hypothetical protein